MASPAPQRRFQNPALFICDIQEKFRSAIFEFDKVVLTTSKMLRACAALQIPVYVTTQNRARLGDTVAELQAQLQEGGGRLVRANTDKTRFSMWIPAVTSQLAETETKKKSEIVIVGIEAHICVTQTALDALAAGYSVYVLADGVSSCNRDEVGVALARLRAAGAVVTTSESWIYECLGDAAAAEFKTIVGLVKETGRDTKAALEGLLSPRI
ncbi:Isochorismatase-like protein [Lasiosphaeria miniovina]|uniref:Isochorismatase-like protein n=1 Tax=Lasiosphaeria miniovina TaxID=1954250 RepID=A0AA40AUQ3_9PEZI|nr:Isochorismatase-like protein [Lasiosphaeria miniovina]KAK0722371.1 Isochorismatase-like protein [Lasiosphaeria miniovina]